MLFIQLIFLRDSTTCRNRVGQPALELREPVRQGRSPRGSNVQLAAARWRRRRVVRVGNWREVNGIGGVGGGAAGAGRLFAALGIGAQHHLQHGATPHKASNPISITHARAAFARLDYCSYTIQLCRAKTAARLSTGEQVALMQGNGPGTCGLCRTIHCAAGGSCRPGLSTTGTCLRMRARVQYGPTHTDQFRVQCGGRHALDQAYNGGPHPRPCALAGKGRPACQKS